MSDLNKMTTVRVGLHTNNTTFGISDVPGTLPFVEPEVAELLPKDTERIERDLYREDNQDYSSIVGVKGLSEIALTLLLRGVATNDGAAMNRLTESEIGNLLDAVLGTGVDPAGTATTVTGDTGASALLNVTSDANVVAGDGVLFSTSTENTVREVLSKAANVLTLDRAWTDGAPGADNVLYRSCHWDLAPATSMHKHLFIRGEGENWRRDYAGCLGTLTFEVAEKSPVKAAFRLTPNDWADAAEANPTFTAPTAGNYVMGINSRLWVAGEAFMVKGATFNTGITIRPRETVYGANGQHGYIVTRKSPTIEGMLYFGTGGASFGEIADSTGNISLNKIQGLTTSGGSAKGSGETADTYDCALQIDNRPGSALYVRMPAAEFSGQLATDNGVEMIRFTLRARRPSSGSPCRIHLF